MVRCEIAIRSCPGTACFAAIKNRTGSFSMFAGEDIEITGMVSCGGCPGRDAHRQVKEMINRGAEVIFICTCLIKL
ncbi:MAG: CGGC domain-containing protein [Nitrospirae bacterium]|nr:CGGC domain-containing protein [Nitrospirota bacterium]